ncbi:MAG: hypothetical protein HY690_05030, partial [Chloroflexi bacterium]|nr:hypothetical protein [Chloroflexota bacterium]
LMDFTIDDFQDLLRILDQHPEWRDELRRRMLSDEVVRLPTLVVQLAEAQTRTEQQLAALTARVDQLAQAQTRTEQQLVALTARVDQLAQAQTRTEQQLAALTARVDQLTVRVDQLTARVDQLTARVDQLTARVDDLTVRLEQLTARVDDLTVRLEQLTARVDDLTVRLEQLTARVDQLTQALQHLHQEFVDFRAEVRGENLERRYRERAHAYFGPLLRRLRVPGRDAVADAHEDTLSPQVMSDLLQADLILQGLPRSVPERGEVWLVVEVSTTVDRHDVDRAASRAGALRQAGRRALPGVAGEKVTEGALRRVEEERAVLLLDGVVAGWEAALDAWAPPPGPSSSQAPGAS